MTAVRSLLEYARGYMEDRWQDVNRRSRSDLMDVYADAIWAHTDDALRPERAAAVAFAKEVLAPMSAEELAKTVAAMPEAVKTAGAHLYEASLPVRALEGKDAIRHVVQVLSTSVDGKASMPTYTRRRRAALSQLLDQAVRDELLAVSPLARLAKPKRTNSLRRISSREVVSLGAGMKLLELCLDAPATRSWAAFLACGLLAGRRPAEIGGLTWADLTLPEEGWGKAVLHVAPQRVKARSNAGVTRSVEPLKWRVVGDERPVPLGPLLIAFLRQHRQAAPEGKRGPADRVFLNTLGNPVNPNDASRVLRDLRGSVFADPDSPHYLADPTHPLREITAYALRHHAATVWLDAGVAPTVVAERLGHSVSTLTRVYAGFLRAVVGPDNAKIDAWYEAHHAAEVPVDENPEVEAVNGAAYEPGVMPGS